MPAGLFYRDIQLEGGGRMAKNELDFLEKFCLAQF